MPFIAIDTETDKRVDITEEEDPRELKGKAFRCQLCEVGMFVKAGFKNAAHFAHKGPCNSGYRSHPETEFHRQGKKAVAKFLREYFKDYADPLIEYEVPIKEVMRVADVLVTLPMGWRMAHEVQLARIEPKELAERTEDYAKAGIDAVWWLGQKAGENPANRDWCIEQTGICHTISFYENKRSETIATFPVVE